MYKSKIVQYFQFYYVLSVKNFGKFPKKDGHWLGTIRNYLLCRVTQFLAKAFLVSCDISLRIKHDVGDFSAET